MPKKKALDTAKLIEMVKAETPSAEIMKKMGFKTSTQLKAAYMSALIAEGKVPAIKGGRGAGKSASVKAGEKVCAMVFISSKARVASLAPLAVAPVTYSRMIGKTFQREKPLKARMISTPAC